MAEEQVNPHAEKQRRFLRKLAVILLLPGLILVVTGFYFQHLLTSHLEKRFDTAWNQAHQQINGRAQHNGAPFLQGAPGDEERNSLNEQPVQNTSSGNDDWPPSSRVIPLLIFSGIILLAASAAAFRYGYMGVALQYVAGEAAPVGARLLNFFGIHFRATGVNLTESAGSGENATRESQQRTVEARLLELEDLLKKGIIQQSEYEKKRAEIIASL